MTPELKLSERHRQRTSRGHEQAALMSSRKLTVPEYQQIHAWLTRIEKGDAQPLIIDSRPLNDEEARCLRSAAQALREDITKCTSPLYWVGDAEKQGRAKVDAMARSPAAINRFINKAIRLDAELCDPKIVDTVSRFLKKEIAQFVAEPARSR